MLIKQYEHRLPFDYDIDQIRARGRVRGAAWDDAQGLAFKAFALRERGVHGAPHHAYTSIYLWLSENAAADFVTGPRFRPVLESFGRPEIRTWLPIAVQVNDASRAALSIYKHEFELDEEADLIGLRRAETARAEAAVTRRDTIASVVGLDVSAWKLLRLEISAAPLRTPEAGIGYEIAYLAAPGWRGTAPAPAHAAAEAVRTA
ncbi:DUF4865 family protein [Burkholderia gladioli]|uniref:DUF4865 family protein n=1 Tax=Burkholderia gladioli TaxID=28095 RepID=UPI000CFE6388|nr:DUF4865 family protein [Burkholderia gladioli]MBJ9660428.1 DUF4865 family protein [Burkholderia gladioli]MDN7804554.1 DUF4865 family protein [Burkholderia gladioli]PRE89381.1 DUF4865 domain-containing protein [Burkholderia gladioli]